MMVFDAHIHNIGHESGGLLIGLEGNPSFEGTLCNSEVLQLHNPASCYYSFYYVSCNELKSVIFHPYLKFHPRREKYSPEEIIQMIQKNQPRGVIIDSLNEPFWKPYDYWEIARRLPEIPFLFAHAGGYLINDFIKICHFQKNVWLDFSLTHTVIGKLGDKNTELPYVNQAIKYALHSSFKNRVLLGSDFPFFNQDDVFLYYNNYLSMLNDNFQMFVKEIE